MPVNPRITPKPTANPCIVTDAFMESPGLNTTHDECGFEFWESPGKERRSGAVPPTFERKTCYWEKEIAGWNCYLGGSCYHDVWYSIPRQMWENGYIFRPNRTDAASCGYSGSVSVTHWNEPIIGGYYPFTVDWNGSSFVFSQPAVNPPQNIVTNFGDRPIAAPPSYGATLLLPQGYSAPPHDPAIPTGTIVFDWASDFTPAPPPYNTVHTEISGTIIDNSALYTEAYAAFLAQPFDASWALPGFSRTFDEYKGYMGVAPAVSAPTKTGAIVSYGTSYEHLPSGMLASSGWYLSGPAGYYAATNMWRSKVRNLSAAVRTNYAIGRYRLTDGPVGVGGPNPGGPKRLEITLISTGALEANQFLLVPMPGSDPFSFSQVETGYTVYIDMHFAVVGAFDSWLAQNSLHTGINLV